MKGTDVTKRQLAMASKFLAARGWPETMTTGNNRREDIVRLLAWYGGIRFVAAKQQIGTLESPGEAAEVPARG